MSDTHTHMHTNKVEEPTPKSEVALREEVMLEFWREHDIFKQSIETPAGSAPKGDFVFYDGPPFATGLPHYGHILASAIKDAIPRFWTMRGYKVERKWGWDCHGLPLENLIEKKLGLATKRDIETFGVKNFNEAARSAVMEYADEWKRIIPRMGRWADMEDDYKTMDSTYTESVWWVFSQLNKKGLVFEGFKSMHLCPRCGTTLSNFEVNLGYKDIKDIAVTVKLPLVDEPDTSLLVWTTTPWTLPGNLAAAVHNEHDYVKVKVTTESGGEQAILAKARLAQLGTEDYEILTEFKGSDLVGKSYEPPFPWLKEHLKQNEGRETSSNQTIDTENAWKIYHADYVELGEEGTGAVHLAPAYGEDDMQLAKQHGVPIVHHVDADGHFMNFVTDFAGQLVKPKDDDAAEVSHLDADIEVVKKLKEVGKLFRKENITHSYPHCWRCDTPLLNYATTSWFVNVPKIKDELVAENNKVKWVPEHVGTARFGKWLEGARDWAVSRQRYWGAPLPIWRNSNTGEYQVLGSLEELQAHAPKSGNTYYTMRHGESEKNVAKVITDKFDAPYPLTEKGREDVKETAAGLRGKIDLVISSPVMRARETAELMVSELGLSAEQLLIDERIRESEHGVWEGKSVDEFYAAFPDGIEKFAATPEGGESWSDIKKRMGAFLYSLEETYQGKSILIVSHGDPLALLHASASGIDKEATVASWSEHYPEKGVAVSLPFVPMPHNDDFELDFHRPYIDNFVVYAEDGTKLERVPDVFDCWFESGSMPYGQHHYPFSCGDDTFLKGNFPANFIAEGLDQTRGWFYSLIVLGTALFGKSPYENVIVNGLVLAEDGKKMSKSLQNYPDPMLVADTAGADAMRHYLLSSPVIRGEDLNFSEQGVLELQRKNIGRLHNVLNMWQTYAEDEVESRSDSTHVLDRWILARLNQLIADSTTGYENYELDKATRPITDFIDDLSVWYLRRSRERLKSDDTTDKAAALSTMRFVFKHLALVMAPVMPFYADYLWQEVKEDSDVLSVHLGAWPENENIDIEILNLMQLTRDIVSMALEQRAKNNSKIRQPLASLEANIKLPEGTMSIPDEFRQLVQDEVNVKKVNFHYSIKLETGEYTLSGHDIRLDMTLTPELKAEGDARELIRAIQDMRKAAGLLPHDRIALTIQTSDGGETVARQFETEIKKVTGTDSINFGDANGTEVKAGDHEFTVELKKV